MTSAHSIHKTPFYLRKLLPINSTSSRSFVSITTGGSAWSFATSIASVKSVTIAVARSAELCLTKHACQERQSVNERNCVQQCKRAYLFLRPHSHWFSCSRPSY